MTTDINNNLPIPIELIERRIHVIREQKVMLDADLAELYQVSTKRLNEAVARNRSRFPSDFMFRITEKDLRDLRSQFATSRVNHGGRRYMPYAFTEHGVAMLSSILKSRRATEMNIQIIRAFIKLRELIGTNKDLAHKIESLEQKYSSHDVDIQTIFTAIKKLIRPSITEPEPSKPRIGFTTER